MAFKIEKDVPVPVIEGRGRNALYPWKQMNAGDSFVVPLSESRAKSFHCLRTSLIGSAKVALGKTGCVTTRILEDEFGVRVWRIK